jgi:hypothetical protein
MIDKTALLLLVGSLAPLACAAQGLDYTYAEASYTNTDLDVGPKISGDGLKLEGSVAINDRVFALADYAKENFDRGIDTTNYRLGAGVRWPLQAKLDAYADAAWVHSRVETDFGNAHDNGYGVDAGLRSRIGSKIEVQGAIQYVDLDRSETTLALRGRYYLTHTVSVGAGYDINDDNGGWNISLRAEFGK